MSSLKLSGVDSPLEEMESWNYQYYPTTSLLTAQSLKGGKVMNCILDKSQGGKCDFILHETTRQILNYRPIIKLKNSVKLVEGENGLLDIVEK